MSEDMSRRKFLQVGTTSLLALSAGSGGVDAQQIATNANVDDFQGVADLLGPESARPAPESAFFDDKPHFAYRYQATDSGAEYFITQDDSEWSEIRMNPETQVEEVRVEDYQAFFNHTFARPESPDTKNWVFNSPDVTKSDSEIGLASTATLESTQRGNYPPGTEAIPGCAFRVTSAPSSGRGDAGYFTDSNGFGAGEDSTGSYVFIRKNGSESQIYRSNWNGYDPGRRVWTNDKPVVTRFPHLFYGGGAIKVRALLHEKGETKLRTLHTFTPENIPDTFGDGPPFNQPNLPIRFESSSLSGGEIRANAAHYEFGESDTENRINGEHFNTSAGSTGWTPLIAWRKRTNWEMVNVKPLKVDISASGADAKLAIQLNPSLSGGTWDTPTNTSSSETAVEVNTGVSLDSDGERRWVGSVSSGQGNKSAGVRSNDLNFNLPATQEVVLVAQGIGASADLVGDVAWEEMF